jgi:hypothetical protein
MTLDAYDWFGDWDDNVFKDRGEFISCPQCQGEELFITKSMPSYGKGIRIQHESVRCYYCDGAGKVWKWHQEKGRGGESL